MRRISSVVAVFLAMAMGDAYAQCPDVALKTHMPRRVSLGKKFTVKARVQLGAESDPVDNLFLQIELPQGFTYAGPSKSLPNAPVIWGANANILYWPLPELSKRVNGLSVNLALATCRSASLPTSAEIRVSTFMLEAGVQVCADASTTSVTIRKNKNKGWPACTTSQCLNYGGFKTIAGQGRQFNAPNGPVYGALLKADGTSYVYTTVNITDTTRPLAPAVGPLNAPYNVTHRATPAVGVGPDMPTLHYFESNGKTFLFNNVEDYPSTMYVSELSRAANGELTMLSTRGVASPLADGAYAFLCAGSITPWGSKLVGEESAPDARLADPVGASAIRSQVRAYDWYNSAGTSIDGKALPSPFPNRGDITNNATAKAAANAEFKPYNVGSIVEAVVSPTGGVTATKLWTMGRIAHELALVLPDRRTVLTTDDWSNNGVILMFVADRADDLTSGELFAARLTGQTGPINIVTGQGAEWAVSWVSLAQATQAELEAMRPTLTFANIFETGTCAANVTCPADFKRVLSSGYVVSGSYCECLKLKPGKEKAAAFFESRRYAGYMGATTEFSKAEGITYSPELRKIYLAITRFKTGMLNGATTSPAYAFDLNAARDDLRLPDNSCGGILELDLVGGATGTSWLPSKARMFITGTMQTVDAQGNTCVANGLASPDNVFVVPGTSTLLIAEDSSDHTNNVLWSLDLLQKAPYQPWPTSPMITRILSTPRGAEVTGNWASASGPFTYLTMSVQHPAVPPAVTGYLGPIPTSLLTPRDAFEAGSIGALRRLVFDPLAIQTGGANQDITVGSAGVCVV